MTVATVLPDRSLQQRRDALGVANGIRIERAAAKRRWKTRPRTEVAREIAALLDNPPEVWLSMRVHDLLRAIPSFGHGRASSLMVRRGISFNKTVGGLSPRQRAELSTALLMVPPPERKR